MNRIEKYQFLVLIIFLIFLIFPFNVKAKNYLSDYINPKNEVELDTNEFMDSDNLKKISYRTDVITESIELSSILKPSENSEYKKLEYVIDKYNIDMVVNKNNTLDITETITAYFNVSKHGIVRKIPFRNKITRLDGTSSKNNAKITNLELNHEYTVSKEDGYYTLKIGSPNTTLIGKETYIIKYNYDIGKDPLRDKDELYFNLIGNEWDTVIGNVAFNITMPEEFDTSKLGFSAGAKGSIENKNVNYTVDGKKITGSYKGILKDREALTVRLELPDGYFVGAHNNVIYSVFVVFISVVSIIICFVLWHKYGRDDKVIETVEFYPPNNFNSCEIQYLYDGSSNNKGAISLLIYLANKGYLKIEETESDNFKITKLKDYDGPNKLERDFFKGLFCCSKSKSNTVSRDELHNSFYETIFSVKYDVEDKFKRNIYTDNGKRNLCFMGCIFIILFVVALKVVLEIVGEFNSLFFIVIPALILGDALVTLMFSIFPFAEPKAPAWSLIVIVSLFVVPLLVGVIVFSNDGYIESERIFDTITALISIVIIMIFGRLMTKRNKFGNETLGKIKGFKNFLETVEKPQLEALVEQNPEYFYHILPYTYALGISKTWIKKFEAVSLQAPNWYSSGTTFEPSHFIDNTMSKMNHVMTSSPSSGSSSGSSSGGSSGSSGGGSSGGGSGGGGGSSW